MPRDRRIDDETKELDNDRGRKRWTQSSQKEINFNLASKIEIPTRQFFKGQIQNLGRTVVAMMVVSVGTGYRVRVLLDLDRRHGPAIRYLQFNLCNTMYLGNSTHTGTDKFKARNVRANVVTTDESSSSCCCCSVRPLWALRSTWQPSVTADKEHWREKEKEEWDFAKFKLEAKITLPERTFLDVCLSCHSYASLQS